MKLKLIPLLMVIPLTACSQSSPIESKTFSFDTVTVSKLYEGEQTNLTEIEKIITRYDKLSDNYENRGINNVYTINNTNDEITIDNELYTLLKASFDSAEEGASYFNPLCGSLAKKWKKSLKNKQILDEITINEELDKINNSQLLLKNNNVVQRIGEAEIDLGGIVKGYVLDRIKEHLSSKGISHYLIDSGSSSILLGEKKNKDGLFTIGLNDLPNKYLKLKNCFVSTSGVSTQGTEIDGKIYSHIVNPTTGSVLNNYDTVIVVSEKGYYGDAISTSMMMNSIEEIKALETEKNLQVILIKDKKIIYQNENLKVYSH